MSLSQTVVHLAERLRPLAGEKYEHIIDVLITMPHWVAVRDMTEWEERCVAALYKDMPEHVKWHDLADYSVPLYLMHLLYDFGCCNLYAAYREKYTRNEYEKVIETFRRYNVPGERPSSEEDLSCW